MISYILLLGLSWWALEGESGWFWDASVQHLPFDKIPSRLKGLYFIETAYYLYTLVAMFFEPKMKDRKQMIFHHIFTITLLATSYFW